jgi:hypothetical protein
MSDDEVFDELIQMSLRLEGTHNLAASVLSAVAASVVHPDRGKMKELATIVAGFTAREIRSLEQHMNRGNN